MVNNGEELIFLQIDKENFLKETKKIADPDNFIEFLDLCAHNITMSFKNQVFLYKQEKDIYNACGIRAKIAKGDRMSEIATATVLLLNLNLETNDELKSQYLPIEVVGDTSETHANKPFPEPIPDLIAQSGIVVELVQRGSLLHPLNKADYDINKGAIQVANGLNQQQYAEALITAFTKMCLELHGVTDKIIQTAVVYVVSKYFDVGAQKGIQGILFKQIFSYSDEDFANCLEEISLLSFSVVESLVGQLLSFDETSIVNAYLADDNVDAFDEELLMLQRGTDDKKVQQLLSELADKFRESTLDSAMYLLDVKEAAGSVYTYPPFRFQKEQGMLQENY